MPRYGLIREKYEASILLMNLQISQDEYTIFSANIFVGRRVLIHNLFKQKKYQILVGNLPS
jgi:hypothetical protein